jgi:hypothetical protein
LTPPLTPLLQRGESVRRALAGGEGGVRAGLPKTPFVLCVPSVFFVLKNPVRATACGA